MRFASLPRVAGATLVALAVAAGAAAAHPSDTALAQRMLVRPSDLSGSTVAGRAKQLSTCTPETAPPSGRAYGDILLFGQSEVISAASVYARPAEARAALARAVKGLSSPCLERTLTAGYKALGRRFAPGLSELSRSPGRTRIRLHFVLRDENGHTGAGVYDVLLLQRGRSLVGVTVVNPIGDRWERALADKIERRLV